MSENAASDKEAAKGVPASGAGARLTQVLDPAVLARIDNLDLVARTVMKGFVGGAHPTSKLGISTEFAEYRGYVPGDDVRFIDWRLYGRSDKLFLKSFEADSNADFVIALDRSNSMNFASGGVTKFDYARMAAASLVHLGARQRDRVALATFNTDIDTYIPPAVRHRGRIIRTLEACEPGGSGDLEQAMKHLAARLGRKAIIIVLSDCYCAPETAGRSMQLLRLQGHDVALFQVLTPRERDFELGAVEAIQDLETGEIMPVDPSRSAPDFAAAVEEHLRAVKRECAARDVDYALLDTDTPLEQLLFAYLSQRARRNQVRRR